MDIVRFDVGDTRMVTLHMSGMPEGVKSSQTTVYIAGEPQGRAAVYPSEQRIEFQATADARPGPITVMIDTDDGETLDAQSATDYDPHGGVPENQRPVVTGISRTSAAPRERVTLKGRNLGHVTSVGFDVGAGYRVALTPGPQPTYVAFTVPDDVTPSEHPYQLFIKTQSSGGFLRTNQALTVIRR